MKIEYDIKATPWKGPGKTGEEKKICSGITENESGEWLVDWAEDYVDKMGHDYCWSDDVQFALYYKLCEHWVLVKTVWGSEV